MDMYMFILICTHIYMHNYNNCIYKDICIWGLDLCPIRPLRSLSLELVLVLQLGPVLVLVLLEVLEVQQQLQRLEEQELAADALFELSRLRGCCSRRSAGSPQGAACHGA